MKNILKTIEFNAPYELKSNKYPKQIIMDVDKTLDIAKQQVRNQIQPIMNGELKDDTRVYNTSKIYGSAFYWNETNTKLSIILPLQFAKHITFISLLNNKEISITFENLLRVEMLNGEVPKQPGDFRIESRKYYDVKHYTNFKSIEINIDKRDIIDIVFEFNKYNHTIKEDQ